jgi:hypothetical protein
MRYDLKLDSDGRAIAVNENTTIERDDVLPVTVYGPSSLLDYGTQFQENSYYLLENFSSASQAPPATPGMLWLDTTIATNPTLKLFTDAYIWKRVAITQDAVERIAVVDSHNRTNYFRTGLQATASIINAQRPVNNALFKWYLNGVLISSGPSMLLVAAGNYHVSYTYVSRDGEGITVQSANYRVVRESDMLTDTLGLLDFEITEIPSRVTVILTDPDVTAGPIKWEWTKDAVSFGNGSGADDINVFIPPEPGDYTVTAKYNDQYHIGDDKQIVSSTITIISS